MCQRPATVSTGVWVGLQIPLKLPRQAAPARWAPEFATGGTCPSGPPNPLRFTFGRRPQVLPARGELDMAWRAEIDGAESRRLRVRPNRSRSIVSREPFVRIQGDGGAWASQSRGPTRHCRGRVTGSLSFKGYFGAFRE